MINIQKVSLGIIFIHQFCENVSTCLTAGASSHVANLLSILLMQSMVSTILAMVTTLSWEKNSLAFLYNCNSRLAVLVGVCH